jgi:hypothetical protein
MTRTVRIQPVPPLTQDGYIQQRGISAISLRNAGNTTVQLWGGMWTLDEKETLSFSVMEANFSIETDIPVTFDTRTGTEKKLQIIVTKDCI